MSPSGRLNRKLDEIGCSPNALAEAVGLPPSCVYDLITDSSEIEYNLSCLNLCKIAGHIKCHPVWIVSGDLDFEVGGRLDKLFEQLTNLVGKKTEVDKLENAIGYTLFKDDWEVIPLDEWNVEMLQNLCSFLKIDWRAVLSEYYNKNNSKWQPTA